ncbi:hypothetical protein NliqN6_1578 [Naganishia liquefaciens]|uniref:CENP-V/GFA domain-containing protein n=1 Tax=Naganishia liquefaciens TaxID=104408 RepID=A0A8H3TQN1_9TREE|nr:hypothetical protein NliqN6_1578 [Naganishia liquefaciens]
MSTATKDTRTLTGRCMCGEVEYEVRDFPAGKSIDGTICHCKTCRKMNTMLSYNVRGERKNLHVTKGEPKSWTDTTALSGKTIKRMFCPTCGSALYSCPESAPEVVFLKAGALDQIDEVVPRAEIFVEELIHGTTAENPKRKTILFEGMMKKKLDT